MGLIRENGHSSGVVPLLALEQWEVCHKHCNVVAVSTILRPCLLGHAHQLVGRLCGVIHTKCYVDGDVARDKFPQAIRRQNDHLLNARELEMRDYWGGHNADLVELHVADASGGSEYCVPIRRDHSANAVEVCDTATALTNA